MNKYPHGECGICAGGACHPVCGYTFNGDFRSKATYEAILVAARRFDASAVLRLAHAGAGYVTYNHERGHVQVKSCSGDGIVASLAVNDAGLRLIARSLPPSEPVLAMLSRR
jgi:hypothetical protein